MAFENHPLRLLIDGACPVCSREGEVLKWLDGGRGRLITQDISAPGFDPQRYGLTMQEVMGEIYGITWDGRILRGMEVFREAYAAVGLGWLLAPTGWPIIRPWADMMYKWFARNRLRIGGRSVGCGTNRCRPV